MKDMKQLKIILVFGMLLLMFIPATNAQTDTKKEQQPWLGNIIAVNI
jgi:hypothetical protein